MLQAINAHVSGRLKKYALIQILQGPPTCAILFDGTNHTGEYGQLPVGEMEYASGGPLMPLNDRAESVYVTPATGSIFLTSYKESMHFKCLPVEKEIQALIYSMKS